MKTPILIFTASLFFWACNNDGKDSVQQADSANKAKLDSPATSSSQTTITVNKTDADFLVKAMDGGLMEVELGNIAKQKAKNSRVQNFADMMVVDHSAAGDKIKNLAAARNVTIPAATGDENSKMIRKLSEKSDFDKEYIDAMVDDHKKDVKEFETMSSNAQDSDIRTFITNTLPVLRKHLDSCTAIQEFLKKNHK